MIPDNPIPIKYVFGIFWHFPKFWLKHCLAIEVYDHFFDVNSDIMAPRILGSSQSQLVAKNCHFPFTHKHFNISVVLYCTTTFNNSTYIKSKSDWVWGPVSVWHTQHHPTHMASVELSFIQSLCKTGLKKHYILYEIIRRALAQKRGK